MIAMVAMNRAAQCIYKSNSFKMHTYRVEMIMKDGSLAVKYVEAISIRTARRIAKAQNRPRAILIVFQNPE